MIAPLLPSGLLALLATLAIASPVPTSNGTLSARGEHASTWRAERVHANVSATFDPFDNSTFSKRGSNWGKYTSFAGDQFMDESLWYYWDHDDPTHGKVK